MSALRFRRNQGRHLIDTMTSSGFSAAHSEVSRAKSVICFIGAMLTSSVNSHPMKQANPRLRRQEVETSLISLF